MEIDYDKLASNLCDNGMDFNDTVGQVCALDGDEWHEIDKVLAAISKYAKKEIRASRSVLSRIDHLRQIRLALDIAQRKEWLNAAEQYRAGYPMIASTE